MLTFAGTSLAFSPDGIVAPATGGKWVDCCAAALAAATDYTLGRDVTQNYMYVDFGIAADINTTDAAKALDAARVNYIGQTEFNGLPRVFYQRGVMMGDPSEITDEAIFTNEQWLRGAIIAQLMSYQLSAPRLPANARGTGVISNLISGGVVGSVDTPGTAYYNAVIEGGKTLTALQKQSITDRTGNPEAWRQVAKLGWYLVVAITPRSNPDSRVQEYVAVYTLVYAKADSVKFISGTDVLI